MEKYTFLKFIKIKEKEIKNKIKYLKTQINGSSPIISTHPNIQELNLKTQIGGSLPDSEPLNLNLILLEIAQLESELKSITDITSSPFVKSYETLKSQIDKINENIAKLKKQLLQGTTQDDIDILNKIKIIDKFISQPEEEYYKINGSSQFGVISEFVPLDTLTTATKTMTATFDADIKKIKSNLVSKTNITQTNIKATIKEIDQLISEYDSKITSFTSFKTDIEKIINNFEAEYKFDNIDDIACRQEYENEDTYINVNDKDESIDQLDDKIYKEVLEYTDDEVIKLNLPEPDKAIRSTVPVAQSVVQAVVSPVKPAAAAAASAPKLSKPVVAPPKGTPLKATPGAPPNATPPVVAVVPNPVVTVVPNPVVAAVPKPTAVKATAVQPAAPLAAAPLAAALKSAQTAQVVQAADQPAADQPAAKKAADKAATAKKMRKLLEQKVDTVKKAAKKIADAAIADADQAAGEKADNIQSKFSTVIPGEIANYGKRFPTLMGQTITKPSILDITIRAQFNARKRLIMTYKEKAQAAIDDIKKQIIFLTKKKLLTQFDQKNLEELSKDITFLTQKIGKYEGAIKYIDKILEQPDIKKTTKSIKSIKYYKNFSKNPNHQKNIKYLHKEWLSILTEYKNKLENKWMQSIKSLTGGSPPPPPSPFSEISGFVTSFLNSKPPSVPQQHQQQPTSSQSTSSPSTSSQSTWFHSLNLFTSTDTTSITALIKKFIDYDNKVREFKILNDDIIKKVKICNVRNIQFTIFQRWIGDYVTSVLTKGVYGYYKTMSQGQISYNLDLLKQLKKILDEFTDRNNLKIIEDDVNKFFYKTHFFMINILHNFFDKLLKKWPDTECSVDKVIETHSTSAQANAKYFFLFNLFEKTLTDWSIQFLKKVANYIRINDIKGRNKSKFTFTKAGNQLKLEDLKSCKDADAKKIEIINKIKFKDVFDNVKFAENKIISQYMGISDLLKRNISILILTYGYSGSGKTFTIFGGSGQPGMLQSILTRLGSGIEIKVKTFELYGLGVPYEFYWRKSLKIKHWIYSYSFVNSETPLPNVQKLEIGEFKKYLQITEENYKTYYNKLEKNDITDFSKFTQKIDDYRKVQGRIKQTKNNPASSRSIIVFDFLIIINGEKIHLVIMDLPGKEKIYETYCENNEINVITKYTEMKKVNAAKYVKSSVSSSQETTVLPTTDDIEEEEDDDDDASEQSLLLSPVPPPLPTPKTTTTQYYNNKLIKLLIFTNPLWLSMIPETAELFDNEQYGGEFKLDTLFNSHTKHSLNPLDNYITLKGDKKGDKNTPPYFTKRNFFIKHKVNPRFFNKNKKWLLQDKEFISNLRGLKERALYKIVDLIQNNLEELGKKLNSMVTKYKGNFNDGYSGLEAFYINENVANILQLLSNKVKQDEKENKADIICVQEKYYSKKIEELDFDRVLDDKIKDNDKNVTRIKHDEFYSQLQYLNMFEKTNFMKSIDDNSFITYNSEDIYNNYFRQITEDHFNTKDRKQPSFYKTPYIDMLKIYDYNKVFNKDNPPINEILEPYMSIINNFYLFFVVTNSNTDDNNNICKEQIDLLYETSNLMQVIADPTFVPNLECK